MAMERLSGRYELDAAVTLGDAQLEVLRRSGARAGDLVYVTGSLGGPLAALRDLESGHTPVRHRARFAHRANEAQARVLPFG